MSSLSVGTSWRSSHDQRCRHIRLSSLAARKAFLAAKEEEVKAPDTYCSSQYAPQTRASIVDHLTEVAYAMQLGKEVPFLAVDLLDHLLSQERAATEQGATSMPFWVAACLKLAAEHVHSGLALLPAESFMQAMYLDPGTDYNEFLSIEAFVRMETTDKLTSKLKTTNGFLELLLTAFGINKADNLYHCMSYLTDLSLLEHMVLEFRPSVRATAALVISCLLVGNTMLDMSAVAIATGYCYEPDLRKCMQTLLALHTAARQNCENKEAMAKYAAAKKYASAAKGGVALLKRIHADCLLGL